MTRTTYSLLAGLALLLAGTNGLQATAQEKKDSPQPSNDSQQQNSTNDSPGASNKSPSQTDQQNAAPQDSQNNDSESTNTNKNLSPNNTNNVPNSQDKNADSRTPRESDADGRDGQKNTQSVLKSQNNNIEANRNTRDFRRDFKFGEASERGITVSTLGRNSIFYRAGVRDNDIIVSYGGRRIRNQDDFYRFAVYQPGQRIPIVVWRDGREETVYVVYDQGNNAQTPSNGQNVLGAEFDPRSNDGALIVRVQPSSPAHKAGLMQNDVVVGMNGERVSSGRDAIELVGTLAPGQRLQVEYTRHARVDVVLGNTRDGNVGAATYQTTDRPASVAVGVDADGTRRADSDRNRSDNDDRRENRREGRGVLPRLRN